MRERIKEIIEREGMGQSQFADFIGVNRPTLSHILLGRNNPSMEVVMKIHQKFPKVNILWLIDGVGPYEGDAVAGYTMETLLEDRHADDLKAPAADNAIQAVTMTAEEEPRAVAAASSSGNGEYRAQSRFLQGDLFAENGVFAAESAGAPKNRKEMPLQTPPKAPYLSDTQIEYARKNLQRKIVEIKVFYSDGTYETFGR